MTASPVVETKLLGVIEAGSTVQVLASIPEFFWELSLAIYLIVKGFKPSPIAAGASDEPVCQEDTRG